MTDPTLPAAPPPGGGFDFGSTAPPAAKDPVRVDSGRGTAWWSEGWRLYTAAPGVWMAITVLFVVILVMIGLIPVLGSMATSLLGPVLAGGVLVGCRAVDGGAKLTIGHLFASFSDRLVPLIVVGALYLVGSLVIVAVVAAILFATVGFGGISALLTGDPVQAGIGMLASLGLAALVAVLAAMVLGIPLMMAYWFAPALVVFRNADPVAAMKSSFEACRVNMMSMFVYSLVGLAFAIVASIPFMLGWLVLAPVFVGSVYASYKDIYGDAG